MKKILSALTVGLLLSMCPLSNAVAVGNTAAPRRVIKDYNYYKNLDPSKYEEELKLWYKRWTKKDLNLENPKTFNEKIQWLKLYDSTPIKTQLADKYLVRKFDDIDFDKLPDKFVLKCNHGSGWNLIVTDKNSIDKVEAKKKFDMWMNKNYMYQFGLEFHYKNIVPKIIAEEYLENNNNDLYDYKVWCDNGEPEYIMFLSNRKNGLKMSFFDKEWNLMPFHYSHPQHEEKIQKPKNLDKMIELSKKLSEGFPYVRVDFYVLNNGSIKFGELTFTSLSGVCRWNDEKYDRFLGDKIKLPEKYDYHKLFENN